MSIAPEFNQGSKNDYMLYDAIKFEDVDLLAEVVKNGISKDALTNLWECTNKGSTKFKYMTALTILSMFDTYNDQNFLELKHCVGTQFRSYLSRAEGNEPNQSVEDFETYCDDVLKMLWPVNIPDELCFNVLHLAYYFLTFENLLQAQPYLNKNNITLYQMTCGIYEIIHSYFLLLSEFYKSMGIEKQVLFHPILGWCFDNPNNPVEKTINAYLVLHPEISKKTDMFGVSVDLPIDKYHELVKKTYNYDKIIDELKILYFIDQIEETIKMLDTESKYSVTKEQIISYIVMEFIINNSFTDFLF